MTIGKKVLSTGALLFSLTLVTGAISLINLGRIDQGSEAIGQASVVVRIL